MPAISTSALAQLDPHQLWLTIAEPQGLTQTIYSISQFLFFKGIILSVFVPSAMAGCPCQGAALGSAGQELLLLEAQAARVSKG